MGVESAILIILYLVLPAIAANRILAPFNLFSSSCLRVTAALLLGHVVATIAIATVATLLTPFCTRVLLWATLSTLALAALCTYTQLSKLRLPPRRVVLCSLLFGGISYLIFSVHLALNGTEIYASPVYWDFPCHLTSIQGFVHGDNFPPQIEVHAGVFQAYHFLANVPMAVFAALGLHPTHAITWYSIFACSILLLTLVGVCEELFSSTTAGIIAVTLALTSSSLRFIDFFRQLDWSSPLAALQLIITNDADPYSFSFEPSSPFGYQGVMYNLFYFIEERQLLLPAAVFLISPLIFIKLSNLSLRACVALGLGLGLFLIWHAYVTLAILASLVLFIPFSPDKRKAVILLAASAILVGPLALLMKSTMASPEFETLPYNTPRINFNFISDERLDFGFSVPNLIDFYVYGYGFKIVTACAGLIALRSRSRLAAHAFAIIIFTVFALTNSIQIAASSIHENHKWLRTMGLLLDVLSAGALLTLTRASSLRGNLLQRRFIRWPSISALMILLTISGVIEAIPFLRSQPTELWLSYPSAFDAAIHRNSEPHDVFATSIPQRVIFSGRKVYVAPTSAWSGSTFTYHSLLDTAARVERQDDLLYELSYEAFCQKANSLGVQVVEISSALAEEIRPHVKEDTIFEAPLGDDLPPITFFHTARGCR